MPFSTRSAARASAASPPPRKRSWTRPRAAAGTGKVIRMARQDAPPFYPDKSRLLVVIGPDGKEQPISTAPDAPRRRPHILASMQLVMGPMPADDRKVPPDVQVYDETRQQRYVRKTISYLSEAGDRVPAFLLIPHEIKGRVPGMLCLHQTTAIG